MTPELVKFKRQIRDFFNKKVVDEETLIKVAKVIGYRKEVLWTDK